MSSWRGALVRSLILAQVRLRLARPARHGFSIPFRLMFASAAALVAVSVRGKL
jgi:hypothetical protein